MEASQASVDDTGKRDLNENAHSLSNDTPSSGYVEPDAPTNTTDSAPETVQRAEDKKSEEEEEEEGEEFFMKGPIKVQSVRKPTPPPHGE